MALMRKGYHFSGWLRAQDSGSDGSATPIRLFGGRTLVVRGPEAVELFYDPVRVARHGATPRSIAHTFFGRNGVHGLDGVEHRKRKRLFLDVTAPDRVSELADLVAGKWEIELDRWVRNRTGAVFPTAVSVLGEAVQEWADVDDAPVVMGGRSADLAEIVDGFRSPSGAWRARRARSRADAWAAGLIEDVRAGRRRPGPQSASAVMAHATDLRGKTLPTSTAAVELLNVLRPTIAVAYFVSFAALELEANPDLNDGCASGDPRAVEEFCQEVRRMCPMTPLLAGRSRCPFTWRQHEVREGDRLLLDVYGADHDPDAWVDASTFDPSRFRGGAAQRRDFIPQGGGRVETGHRCPGEGITLALLQTVVPALARLDWSIHPDDRVMSLRRMPARPGGGVRLLDVRRHHLREVG